MRVVLARDKKGAPEGRVYFRGEITLHEAGDSDEVAGIPSVTYFAEEAFVFASTAEAEKWAHRLAEPVFLLSKPAFLPVVLAEEVDVDIAVPGAATDTTDGGEVA